MTDFPPFGMITGIPQGFGMITGIQQGSPSQEQLAAMYANAYAQANNIGQLVQMCSTEQFAQIRREAWRKSVSQNWLNAMLDQEIGA